MRTTLDIPDDLVRAMKIRAAQTDATLTSVITQTLRAGLAVESERERDRVQFPLVRGSRRADPEELSPERISELDAAHDLASTDLLK